MYCLIYNIWEPPSQCLFMNILLAFLLQASENQEVGGVIKVFLEMEEQGLGKGKMCIYEDN